MFWLHFVGWKIDFTICLTKKIIILFFRGSEAGTTEFSGSSSSIGINVRNNNERERRESTSSNPSDVMMPPSPVSREQVSVLQ